MTFVWPWSLPGLLAVAIVALWTLRRGERTLLAVGSLRIWKQVLGAHDRGARRRRSRVSWSWLLLLVGAVAGVLGLGRPVVHLDRPIRRIAVGICPSVELSGSKHQDFLRDTVSTFLQRLRPDDRIRLLLPLGIAAETDWRSPGEVRDEISSKLAMVPLAGDEYEFPEAPDEAQHTYLFVPAGARVARGPCTSVVELPTSVAPVTIDALGAEELAGGKVQLFVAARNHTDILRSISIRSQGLYYRDVPASAGSIVTTEAKTIAPGGRGEFVLVGDDPPAFGVYLLENGRRVRGLGADGYILSRSLSVRRVAMLGRDCAPVRRFVKIDKTLELVSSVEDADLVICNGVDPPPGKPALVIDPVSPPVGWRGGKQVTSIVMSELSIASDDPVMQHVDLDTVAVRRLTPWVSGGAAEWKVLCGSRDQVIILRNEPTATVEDKEIPGRVCVAFDLSEENTNFTMTPAFVVFLANTTRWLVPAQRARTQFRCAKPSDVLVLKDEPWDYLGDDYRFSPCNGAFRGPGVYRPSGTTGEEVAVSLVALTRAEPEYPPMDLIASLPLPDPRPLRQGVECSGGLILGTVLLWLLGWRLRAK